MLAAFALLYAYPEVREYELSIIPTAGRPWIATFPCRGTELAELAVGTR